MKRRLLWSVPLLAAVLLAGSSRSARAVSLLVAGGGTGTVISHLPEPYDHFESWQGLPLSVYLDGLDPFVPGPGQDFVEIGLDYVDLGTFVFGNMLADNTDSLGRLYRISGNGSFTYTEYHTMLSPLDNYFNGVRVTRLEFDLSYFDPRDSSAGLRHVTAIRSVPEPGTLALLFLGLVGLGARLRTRSRSWSGKTVWRRQRG